MELIGAAFGGLALLGWGWLIFLLFIVAMDIFLTENEFFGSATLLTLLGTAAAAWLGGGVNVFAWVWANLASIISFFIGYFAIGAGWSVIKWYFHLLDVREGHREIVNRYKANPDRWHEPPIRPDESFARYNISRIMGWIGHWPFSMLATIFGDVLTRLVKTIYNQLSSLYDRIGNFIFKEFN